MIFMKISSKIFGVLATRVFAGIFIAGIAGVLFFGNFFTTRGPVEASADTYYPTFCLGGWENPKLASEKPAINPKDLGAFTPENSAFLADDISAQIFCGYFPVVGRDKLPMSARVSFNWLLVGEPIAPVVEEAPAEEAPIESGEGEVLGEETQTGDTPADVPEPAPDTTPAPSDTTPTESESPAPASDAPSGDTGESSGGESSSESGGDSGGGDSGAGDSGGGDGGGDSGGGDSGGDAGGGDSGGGDSSASSVFDELASLVRSRASAAFAEDAPSIGNDLLDVSYSFDGVRWQSAGRVGRDNWRDFSILIPATSWQELQNLQVMVSALPTLDTRPAIYLESMMLRVSVDRTFAELATDSFAAVGDVVEGLFTLPAPVAAVVEAPVYQAPPAKEKKLSFRVAGSPLDTLGKNLPAPNVSASGDGLSLTVSGKCSMPYFVVLTYRSREDFEKRPRQFASNYAGPCKGGSFTYDMEHLPTDTPEDVYYLVVGEQSDTEPWRATTELVPVEVRTVEITPGSLDE